MSSCAISFIVPAYNAEKYLKPCLDSLLLQGIEDFEILCIDDASKDGTRAIFQEYTKRDSRFRLFHHDVNRGLSAARNTGLKHATGKYICFVDSDDYLKRNAMKKALQIVEKDGLDLLTYGSDIDVRECPTNHRSYDGNRKHDYPSVMTGIECYNCQRRFGEYVCCVWQNLFKRDLLEKNHIEFYDGIIHEDFLFTFKAYMKAKRVAVIKERFYNYRIRSNSLVEDKNVDRHLDGLLISAEETIKYNMGMFPYAYQEAMDFELEGLKHLIRYYGLFRTFEDNCKYAEEIDSPIKLYIFNEMLLGKNNYALYKVVERKPEKEEQNPQEMSVRTELAKKADEIKKLQKKGQVYLYGAGIIARKAIVQLEEANIKLSGVVTSEGGSKEKPTFFGYKIQKYQDIRENFPKATIVLAVGKKNKEEILEKIKKDNVIISIIDW